MNKKQIIKDNKEYIIKRFKEITTESQRDIGQTIIRTPTIIFDPDIRLMNAVYDGNILNKKISYDLYMSDISSAVRDIYHTSKYTTSVETYSNEIRNNVYPVHLESTENGKWEGVFINVDNGNIYLIKSDLFNDSKYRYSFHTIYPDTHLEKIENGVLL